MVKQPQAYLMESQDEALRLDMKTDPDALHKQALWCGIKPGLRVLDLGCGVGKTTSLLHEMVQPGGSIVGMDYSATRIDYARKHYGGQEGIDFLVHDFTEPFDDIGSFDIIWVRFVLEYYRRESPAIVKNLKTLLKPGGYLCLLDLDYNCLSHYELPAEFADLLPKLMAELDRVYNFDTYAGRKLYAYLYDTGYENIQMELMAHHLIYGEAGDVDIFNWMKKLEIMDSRLRDFFDCYPGGYEAFFSDFKKFFLDPRRFTYTPLILCKGRRPLSDS
jgi:ubiquinone/menaquinone biosynthesis C-methylase UbiE